MRLKISLLTLGVLLYMPNLFSQFTFVEKQQDGVGFNTELNGAMCVVVSPDDKHLYVGSGVDWGVTTYSINSGTGALTWIEEHATDPPDGWLARVFDMDMDPNGDHLYLVEENDDQVTWYSRNAATGVLTYGGTLLTTSTTAVRTVRVHPNGNFVYVGTLNRLEIFDRNPATGVLTANTTINSGVVPGIPICAAPFFRYCEGLDFSPDRGQY